MKNLLELLQYTHCLEDALIAEEAVKEVWKAHINQDTRWEYDDGITHLFRGDKEESLSIYNHIIESDPGYSEAWNKKATCHYMLGEMPQSINAAKSASDANPENFQAHAGLGLVYADTNQYKKAVNSFRKCLSFNPWSPVASRLCISLDHLKKLELEEIIHKDVKDRFGNLDD
mmetsp:Transcript_23426/g.34268  ORF Transcript_23426/g.34268 Transcript_23426/m.34268 type:complete len:173 (-) Transcript_23426:58-576(-)